METEPTPVLRAITGFHVDEEGDWVAELACWHNQHVRHRPPFQDRPWVLSESDRRERIGSALGCRACARGELPEGLVLARTVGPFEGSSVPPGLLRAHMVPLGTWGLLRVEAGSARLVFHEPVQVVELVAGDERAIPPALEHHFEPGDTVRAEIRLLMREPAAAGGPAEL